MGGEGTMEPRIDRTQFGSVTIDGAVFTHDVLIRLGGQVQKRKKKLSKATQWRSAAGAGRDRAPLSRERS